MYKLIWIHKRLKLSAYMLNTARPGESFRLVMAFEPREHVQLCHFIVPSYYFTLEMNFLLKDTLLKIG